MNIKSEKLTMEELEQIKKIKRIAIMGNFNSIEEFNTLPWFVIKKFYSQEQLIGYAVLFLGYNGLESNDISIEDIAYWGENMVLYPTIQSFIHDLKNNGENHELSYGDIYYDSNRFIEELDLTFSNAGFQKIGRTR